MNKRSEQKFIRQMCNKDAYEHFYKNFEKTLKLYIFMGYHVIFEYTYISSCQIRIYIYQILSL